MFKPLIDRLPLLLAALWWGSLSVIGFMAVPLLFMHLPTPALAGHTAAHLFAAQNWLSLACGLALVLMLQSRARAARSSGQTEQLRSTLVWVFAAMLLALLLHYGVAPRIVARQNLRLWHSLGTLLYVLQWLGAAAVLWRLTEVQRDR